MRVIDKMPIESLEGTQRTQGTTETISFRQFIEESLGVPFEEVYKDYIIHGENNEEGYLE